MKLPEYLLSTPRLVLILLSIALIVLTFQGIVQPNEFLPIVTMVFGYFFGSRGSEVAKGKTEGELANSK